jgi:hypothetical protein
MKMYVGMGDVAGIVHTVEMMSANEHDLNMADRRLHGEEKCG